MEMIGQGGHQGSGQYVVASDMTLGTCLLGR